MYFNRIRSTLLENIMTDWINYAWLLFRQDETVTILHFKYPFRTNYCNRKWANKRRLYLPTLYEVKFVLRTIKRHCVEIISYHNCTQWWILCAIDKLSKKLNDSVNRAYTDKKNCILISWYVTGIPFCCFFFFLRSLSWGNFRNLSDDSVFKKYFPVAIPNQTLVECAMKCRKTSTTYLLFNENKKTLYFDRRWAIGLLTDHGWI